MFKRYPSRTLFRQSGHRIRNFDPSVLVRTSPHIPASAPETYISKNRFANLGFPQQLVDNIIQRNYSTPTPIQDQVIPLLLAGKDVIGLANTGTGKTAAFLLPFIKKVAQDGAQKVLIMAPTRELAVQIEEEFRSFARDTQLYSTLIIGGVNIGRQYSELKRRPNVVIATPGRLKDLVEKRALYLEDYTNIVLDEVDLMVDIGFIADIKYFISQMTKTKQSLFFSATIPPKVEDILRAFVNNPVTVSVKKQETSENVDQDVIPVANTSQKVDRLHDLLIKDGFDKVLVFGRTKHGIEKLDDELRDRGFKVGAIHGNKRQSQRQRILESFKRSEIQVLLATDVASRGLDIPNVTHVINYELPETYEDYIHRIGRTGRANQKGIALTFITGSF